MRETKASVLHPRLPDRFDRLLIPEPNSGCWLFDGKWETGNGYGKTYHRGRHTSVHVAVYELIVGDVPPGHILDHLCRVRCCANPFHLEPVTVKVNTDRGLGRFTQFRRAADYGSAHA